MRGDKEAAVRQHGGDNGNGAGNSGSRGHSTRFSQGTQVQGQPVFTDGGKFAGTVYPDGTFFKAINGSRHLLRRPPAIAYNVEVLKGAEALGGTRLVVLDKETQTRYEASLTLMWERGVKVSRGHGLQRALVLRLWAVSQPRGGEQPVQLSLLGERQ